MNEELDLAKKIIEAEVFEQAHKVFETLSEVFDTFQPITQRRFRVMILAWVTASYDMGPNPTRITQEEGEEIEQQIFTMIEEWWMKVREKRK